MKITEAIEKLQKLIDEYGDITLAAYNINDIDYLEADYLMVKENYPMSAKFAYFGTCDRTQEITFKIY